MTLKIHIKKLSKKEKVCFEEKFKVNVNRQVVYSVIHKGKYIGGVAISRKLPCVNYTMKGVNILFLYIIPKYRGFGIAKKLLNLLLKKYNLITITTDNKLSSKVYNLYKSSGFKVIGKLGSLKYWTYERKVIPSITEFTWFCKKHSCKMLKEACIRRQLMAKLPINFHHSPIYFEAGCSSCKDAAPFT